MSIPECLLGIRKQTLHLVGRLKIVLSSVIAHPLLILNLCIGLDTEKHIVCLPVFSFYIMGIVGSDKLYAKLLGHLKQLCVDQSII